MYLMVALVGMYEKSLANNKVHLMKQLFDLKMSKGKPINQHLNQFNNIINQLFLVEIEFDDEIKALIPLMSLPYSQAVIRMAMSNSISMIKLSYDDILDIILAEDVCKNDFREISNIDQALSVDE